MKKTMSLLFIILSCISLNSIAIQSEDKKSDSPSPLILQLKKRDLTVHGKKFDVYEISQPNGTWGAEFKKGDRFKVTVENHLDVPTGIHWHGLILPSNQDGIPFISQPPIPPGGTYPYDFPIVQSGTFWMHSHFGLQMQLLLEAPLIIFDPKESQKDEQQVVMTLTDFSFRKPIEIFRELQSQGMRMGGGMMGHGMMGHGDLNDVDYDAFLANKKTLSDPDVIQVAPGKTVRLRIINGASATNFWIDLGKLKGEAIAVDGADIEPFESSNFQLAVAQRIDIRIKMPSGSAAYPILAQVEGEKDRTGIVLAQPGAKVEPISELASRTAGPLSYRQELNMKAKDPLSKKNIDRRLELYLGGGMRSYVWTLNGRAWPKHTPLVVKEGERVELAFINDTMMAHPMHLHGHVFQITEIDGRPIAGALRDTVLVQPHSTVKVQFDANAVGNWMLHCHNLYHMQGGMMTTLLYENFKGPFYEWPASGELEH